MKNFKGTSVYLSISLLFLMIHSPAYALNQIVRPYLSVRSMGMGSTRITTGLYDDNFYNNPARVTANPTSRFTLLDLTPIDINSNTLTIMSPLLKGNNALTTITNAAGENLHERLELVLPAYYLAATGDRKFAIAFGMLTSVQTDVDLRQNYSLNLGAVADIGPALTLGMKLLPEDALSVGFTTHVSYRVSTDPNYSLNDYLSGSSPGLSTLAGDGSMINFDIGTTYRITRINDFEISVGGAIQNLMGGQFNSLSLKPLNFAGSPIEQPRSYGFGVSAFRPSWGIFQDTDFALEFTDLLNNTDGSIFRLIHIGAETHWKAFSIRLGVNQGYLTAGLGLDLHYFTLNLATYGEEMGLNAGDLPDRRFAANIGIHF